MAKKSNGTGTRAEVQAKRKPVTVTIGDIPLVVPTKEFSTGSFGWYLNGKTTIEIDGTPVIVQIGLNLTVVGSKELPQDTEAPAAPAPPAPEAGAA